MAGGHRKWIEGRGRMRGNQPGAGGRLHLLLIVLLLCSALAVATQPSGVAHAAVVTYTQLPKLDCSQESSLRSTDGSTSTHIEFVNNSPITVKVYWLDYASGARVLYATLAPGQSYLQQTFVTHPWVVTDLGDVCISIFLPTDTTSSAVVTIPTVPQQPCSL